MSEQRKYRSWTAQQKLEAVARANVKLAELGIDPIVGVTLHGLRRTSASLRCAAGDDVAYTAGQLGHEDATFTLKTYTHSVRRRERLSGAELQEFEKALDWARMGTSGVFEALAIAAESPSEKAETLR